MECGLLGRKLGHSYSPQIHALLGRYTYKLFEKEPGELESFLRKGNFSGINVTIPYKKAVIPYLDALTPVAQRLGSVNTVIRRPDGSLLGHNTDYFGFLSMLAHSKILVSGKKVLVLGSGGASNTVHAALQELGARPVIVSRSGENNYSNLRLHSDTSVIVNTTPVGMYPATGTSPVDLELFPCLEGVLDLIYNPARTQLLLDAESRSVPCENGSWMLVAQAKEAAEYFTDTPVSDTVIAEIHRRLSLRMQNIILVGMPGCGKSTIGKLLAEKCGKTFADADEYITSLAGKSIPQIFADNGEEAFRRWETKALEDLGKQSGLVIATGGGCVTKNRNYPLLHQNGTVFWLKRDLDSLPTYGRPLSQQNDLKDMYSLREPLYASFADHCIDNNVDPEKTISAILAKLEEPS